MDTTTATTTYTDAQQQVIEQIAVDMLATGEARNIVEAMARARAAFDHFHNELLAAAGLPVEA